MAGQLATIASEGRGASVYGATHVVDPFSTDAVLFAVRTGYAVPHPLRPGEREVQASRRQAVFAALRRWPSGTPEREAIKAEHSS